MKSILQGKILTKPNCNSYNWDIIKGSQLGCRSAQLFLLEAHRLSSLTSSSEGQGAMVQRLFTIEESLGDDGTMYIKKPMKFRVEDSRLYTSSFFWLLLLISNTATYMPLPLMTNYIHSMLLLTGRSFFVQDCWIQVPGRYR